MQKRSAISLYNADEELSKYLQDDYERKDKFRKFCRHFGVDVIIPIYQLFSINKMSNQSDHQQELMDPQLETYVQYIVKKLSQEQTNRLKTEEQSAQVIEQLGKTISTLVSFCGCLFI